MSTPSKKQSNVILILSLLLLAFPVYLLLKWVYVFNTMSTHAERVAAFGDHMKATLIATASAVAAASSIARISREFVELLPSPESPCTTTRSAEPSVSRK